MPSLSFTYQHLSKEQRITAVQRLTALWAFCESGLGGVLHALQMPFTGLVVGGLAVIFITLIAGFAEQRYGQILKSLLLVLIIKAMISPYTPFPAYIAVTFQAFLGYALFTLFRINFFSILILSTVAMVESAIQKLLIVTLFFGRSFWKATDELFNFITGQFNLHTTNGSQLIISLYLLIYFIWGIGIAWIAFTILKAYTAKSKFPELNEQDLLKKIDPLTEKRKINLKPWIILAVLIILSVLLFVFAPNGKSGWMAVLKTLSWTTAVMLIWYMLLSPLITILIRFFLNKKMSAYGDELTNALSLFPALKQLAVMAWQLSATQKGWKRWQFFLAALIHWSLIYSGNPALKKT